MTTPLRMVFGVVTNHDARSQNSFDCALLQRVHVHLHLTRSNECGKQNEKKKKKCVFEVPPLVAYGSTTVEKRVECNATGTCIQHQFQASANI